ncbi:protein-L-isoaspartate(D-aspartate) O-methyltransferase [Pseudoduganella lurida]|uniref:Protein-L-isoaspartate O-methyltransferase n=1 Tax=Pseudoduganella lurida TaxID=1036180 RepID=A0A562RBF1_9BURK|nr:protein-L-isoaspartate(D-aspartate) O-methyltransferase [Pseudoduganella lurida]TWI66399.1 protein-L-isoaspartate(D-aspartate) O-methyltransferase [Pseudoduganella lurida]
MTDKPRTFPLPLSSVTDKGQKKPGIAGPVATPQTATRNAAHHLAKPVQTSHASPPAYPSHLSLPAHGTGPGPAKPIAAYQGGSMATVAGTPAVKGASARPLSFEPSHPGMARRYAQVPDSVRRAMVARVAKQGVHDQAVLAALGAVPRHMFMDEGLAAQAYVDASLPIGHQQTISQPYIVARMLEVLRHGGELKKVLEIGTGCGYQAAVLSCISQDVYSIERIKPLHELAKANLRPLRIANLRLHYGDGMLGLPQAAPFDGIILAAAGLEVPQALLDQLTIGGRLVAPVGERTQHLELVTRVTRNEWVRQTLEDCHFVPLRAGTI